MPEFIRNDDWLDIDLDYVGENNFASFFSSDGNLHTYPAKAVPEMANSLLLKLKYLYNIESVLDPFVGSGTIALEAKYLGLDFYGSDLNPLAVLLAKTKVMTIENTLYVKKRIREFSNNIIKCYNVNTPIKIETFDSIDYWFKAENIRQLSFLKQQINKFLKGATKYKNEFSLIVLTAFSSTIRASSLSRNGEFKLYRIAANDIEKFSVNSLDEFKKTTEDLLEMLVYVNKAHKGENIPEIYMENAKILGYMGEKKVDLVMTSPPYGDSQSTVAYGEFSKLSLQWMSDLILKYLNIETMCHNCDEHLLGGKYSVIDTDELLENEMKSNSKYLAKLIADIRVHVETEITELQNVREELVEIQTSLLENKEFNSKILEEDTTLATLIKGNIRLRFLKQIKRDEKISEQEAKERATEKRDEFVNDLKKTGTKEWKENMDILPSLVSKTIKAVTKKIKSLPIREKEIYDFFVDLYQVVKQTEKVINETGIQVWIVGHRTVLGSIEIKLADILQDWFESMSYEKLALIKRNYHYKRLPHHINSTMTRTKEVKTMNEEHILIVQKQK